MKHIEFDDSLVNLHCHSHYCGHGSGEVEEFVQAAIDAGMKILGESEHCPVPDGHYASTRMPLGDLDSYIKDSRDAASKHHDEITMLCGAECDWKECYRTYYEDTILGSKALDYALMSIHYVVDENGYDVLVVHNRDNNPKFLSQYTDRYIKGLESGLFLFGCHPDLFGMMYETWDDQAASCSKAIIDAAKALDMPLEINGLGMMRKIQKSEETSKSEDHMYPIPQFWEMASASGIRTIVSSDSHHPEDVAGKGRKEAEKFASRFGITPVKVSIENGHPVLI